MKQSTLEKSCLLSRACSSSNLSDLVGGRERQGVASLRACDFRGCMPSLHTSVLEQRWVQSTSTQVRIVSLDCRACRPKEAKSRDAFVCVRNQRWRWRWVATTAWSESVGKKVLLNEESSLCAVYVSACDCSCCMSEGSWMTEEKENAKRLERRKGRHGQQGTREREGSRSRGVALREVLSTGHVRCFSQLSFHRSSCSQWCRRHGITRQREGSLEHVSLRISISSIPVCSG